MSIKLNCAEPAGSPEPPCTPGISPTPSSPRITLTVIVQVLSRSTWSTDFAYSERSDLVVAHLLKSSRPFSLNVTLVISYHLYIALDNVINWFPQIQVFCDTLPPNYAQILWLCNQAHRFWFNLVWTWTVVQFMVQAIRPNWTIGSVQGSGNIGSELDWTELSHH